MKKKLYIGILVSVVFLYLAFRKVDYTELWQALKGANYWFIIPNIILGIFTMWMRAFRWKYMVNPIKKVGLGRLFSSVMIGFMGNNVLPARLGEFIRAYSLGSKENISKSASFATIVVERLFDGFSILFILWATLLLFPFPEWVKRGSNLFLLMNLGLLFFLIFLEIKTDSTVKFFQYIFRILPHKLRMKAEEILLKFISGLKVFRNVSSLIWMVHLNLGSHRNQQLFYFFSFRSSSTHTSFVYSIGHRLFRGNVALISWICRDFPVFFYSRSGQIWI
jgi:uncharacterized protein (TIRG00374 family)